MEYLFFLIGIMQYIAHTSGCVADTAFDTFYVNAYHLYVSLVEPYVDVCTLGFFGN